MRNLYKRLDLSTSCWQEHIREAIAESDNSSLRKDATAVLLDKTRRGAYDIINSQLIDIGQLRARLGLSHAENWDGSLAREYADNIEPGASMYEKYTNKIGQALKTKDKEHLLDLVRRFFGMIKSIFVLLIVVVVIGSVLFGIFNKESSSSRVATSSQPQSEFSSFSQPIQATPRNGSIRMHAIGEAVAPLEIKTGSGANYLVKLEESSTGVEMMDIFVHGGQTVKVSVPLGSYTVKYASGEKWYGYKYRFGPKTSYSKAETVFRFRDEGYQISGYSITLYSVANGNLRTRSIAPGQF